MGEAFAGVSWATVVQWHADDLGVVDMSTGRGVQLMTKAVFKSWHSKALDLVSDLQLGQDGLDEWMETNDRQYLVDMHNRVSKDAWNNLALALGDVVEKR